MIGYIIIPDVDVSTLTLVPQHEHWLKDWLLDIETEISNDSVSSAWCIQGILAEIVLYGYVQTDWKGIIKELLKDEEGKPLAYSARYGEKLHNFSDQWKQTPIHAIYTHWWIDRYNGSDAYNINSYRDLITRCIQPSGWIYNPNVSPTDPRTRMKAELMLSISMGVEILSAQGLEQTQKSLFEAILSSTTLTGYLSAECFRMRTLQMLSATSLAPYTLGEIIDLCKAEEGYCDFSVDSKVDDYMGTAKRTSRDKPIHSAISALHARQIAKYCALETQQAVQSRLSNFAGYLSAYPLDIPAFRMRDIEVPFGTDLSPFEIFAASHIISTNG
ncbi:MAG: hypothetical protein F4W91_05470 [Gemmatimonadetes bacterium]|nr:hypothetical protein [Gemmatimonadota bacterium]